MKFSYRFSNLLGTVYRKGNLTFTPDGNSVISPVGNRLSIFDLKNNRAETLPVESQYNITAAALSPDGNLLIAVNEEGRAMLISMMSRSVLHHYDFKSNVHAVSFSPDGSKFAVTKDNSVQVFHAPGRTKEFNPFVLYRVFHGAYDETVCIDWTSDSRAFLVGSKDMNTRIYGSQRFTNLIRYSIGGHSDSIVKSFFEHQSLDMYSLAVNGQLCIWEASLELEDLEPETDADRPWAKPDQDLFDGAEAEADPDIQEVRPTEKEQSSDGRLLYRRTNRLNYKAARGEGAPSAQLTTADFHKPTHILCTGFTDGAFFLHEMPDFNLIHSLSISDQTISAISFNKSGDWLALGCGGIGQLLVWEWQSESYILKQQGHFNNMECLVYSPDGQYIATGGDDSKVKVWNTSNGFCFVTFTEHHASVTGISFSQSGQVVVSASLDGTVRAYDLNRYRNFRTFTSPQPVQFSCLTLDPSGEVVCAGGRDVFEIFVWSMKTGRLLEVLSGHEGPISSLSFSPSRALLASGSWDKTVRLWDVFENKGSRETLRLGADVSTVTFRPDGTQLAVSTLNAQLSFWDINSASQTGSIEGRHDLGYSREDADVVTAKTLATRKFFSTLCYSADGKCMLAAGRSKNVCIYSVTDQILIKKFEITCNLSLDGVVEFLDRRKMTEFGSLALVEEADGNSRTSISLPGTRKGDFSTRKWKPEVRVTGVRFSPTGREWAATTTEGLLVYSLDKNIVFDPFDLEIAITPDNVKKTLADEDYTTALMLAFRLNEQKLIEQVVETIPVSDVEFVAGSLAEVYVDKLLSFLGGQLEVSRHLEYYLVWGKALLYHHGSNLKQRTRDVMPTLRSLQRALTRKYDDLSKICDHNKYTLQYFISLSQHKRKAAEEESEGESGIDDGDEADSDDGWNELVKDKRIASDSESHSDESMET